MIVFFYDKESFIFVRKVWEVGRGWVMGLIFMGIDRFIFCLIILCSCVMSSLFFRVFLSSRSWFGGFCIVECCKIFLGIKIIEKRFILICVIFFYLIL